MSHGARAKLQGLVPHPRYGATVIPSGQGIGGDAVRESFWRYANETIFPESAIRADVSRQNRSVFPRGCYVDTLKRCRKCERPFLFFALEQRHWFEVLGFWIDADCVLCPECRAVDQRLRRHFRRYSERITCPDLTDRQLETLLADAVHLAECGVLKDRDRLRRLRTLARRRIPASGALGVLSAFLDGLQGPDADRSPGEP